MANPKKPTRSPSSEPVYEELRIVRDRVEEVLGVLTYIARDPDLIKRQEAELRPFFQKSRRRAEVFLALSAERNVSQIAAALKMKYQNVSREIQLLRRAKLVIPLSAGGRGEVYVRNPTIDATLELTRKVRDWCGIAPVMEELQTTETALPEEAPVPVND